MACNDINFVPKVTICINNSCDSLCIKETTDVRQMPYMETGWGPVNPTTDDVTGAIIRIYDKTGVTLKETYIIKNTLPTDLFPTNTNTPSPFVAFENAAWGESDGVFKVVYTVTVDDNGSPVQYLNEDYYVLFICNIQTCIDNLKISIIRECDSKKLAVKKQNLDQLEILVIGMQYAFNNADYTTSEELIAAAKIICDNLDCGCGCSDC